MNAPAAGPVGARPSQLPGLALSAGVALALPVALHLAGAAAHLRLAYPAAVLATAGWLFLRRSPWYVGFVVWAFAMTPLVRRLADLASGYDPANPILLAPYLALIVCVPSALAVLADGRRGGLLPFWTLIACVLYGTLVAILGDRIVSGAVDALKWAAAPLFCVTLASGLFDRGASVRTAALSFAVVGAGMAVYGVAQFLRPAPWDVLWVANVGMTSIGQAVPYGLRVFSTMNSPGSLGTMLLASLIFLMRPSPLVSALPACLAMAGLALTQYRSIWVATAVGVAYVALRGTGRQRSAVAAALVALALGGSAAAGLSPEIQRTLETRVRSLSDLSSDASGADRLHQYGTALEGQTVVGEGLAASGNARKLDGGPAVVIDSGLIEIPRALGVLFGPLFLAALAAVCVTAMRSPVRGQDDVLLKAVVLATVIQLPFGSVHVGENGMPFWLAAGLLLAGRRAAAALPVPQAGRSRLPAPALPPLRG